MNCPKACSAIVAIVLTAFIGNPIRETVTADNIAIVVGVIITHRSDKAVFITRDDFYCGLHVEGITPCFPFSIKSKIKIRNSSTPVPFEFSAIGVLQIKVEFIGATGDSGKIALELKDFRYSR